MIKDFFLSRIKDVYVRDNFRKLSDFLKENLFTNSDTKVIATTLNQANNIVKHGLNFKPTDILVTYSTGAVSINHGESTNETITIAVTTPPVDVRVLVGKL
jgi:hypothetical protein